MKRHIPILLVLALNCATSVAQEKVAVEFTTVSKKPDWLTEVETRPGYFRMLIEVQEYAALAFKPERYQSPPIAAFFGEVDLPTANARILAAAAIPRCNPAHGATRHMGDTFVRAHG